MIFDISAISKVDGESITVEASQSFDELKSLLPDYTFDAPIKLEGTVTNIGGHLNLVATVTASYSTKCVRCLEDVSDKLIAHVDETILPEAYENQEAENSEAYTFNRDNLNVDKILIDAIIVNLPSIALCSVDCKGLCPTCGVNLNLNQCSCETEYINPAMEKLKNFFEK